MGGTLGHSGAQAHPSARPRPVRHHPRVRREAAPTCQRQRDQAAEQGSRHTRPAPAGVTGSGHPPPHRRGRRAGVRGHAAAPGFRLGFHAWRHRPRRALVRRALVGGCRLSGRSLSARGQDLPRARESSPAPFPPQVQEQWTAARRLAGLFGRRHGKRANHRQPVALVHRNSTSYGVRGPCLRLLKSGRDRAVEIYRLRVP